MSKCSESSRSTESQVLHCWMCARHGAREVVYRLDCGCVAKEPACLTCEPRSVVNCPGCLVCKEVRCE
jgi:hypothetical protein